MTEASGSAPTRRAVLDLLKRNGEQTVAQLGAALALSGVAVRRHLEVLEHVGLVQQTTRPQGRGRPAYVYALTEMGHDLFPRNYDQLVAQLLEAATSELGPDAVERLFDHRQQELAGPEVEVERIAHIQAGDPVCAYVLRAAQPLVHRGARLEPPEPPT